MVGVFRIRSIGEADGERDSVQLVRQGDMPDQTGTLRLHNELTLQGTRAELASKLGANYGVRDSYLLDLTLTPVAKSKSAGG